MKMDTRFNQEIFTMKNRLFYTEYFELLVNRVTNSSMSLEKDLGNPNSSQNAIRLRDNMKAFKNLLVAIPRKMTEHLIIETGNMVNESAPFIANGYRKTGKFIADTDIPISDASTIESDLKRLLEKYEGEWQSLDPIEREAKFHIEFIKIHPFEDGNGRTGRLLLNYNLIRQCIAPVIITEDLLEYYQSYIKNDDVEGMKRLLQIQSKRELELINQLYDEYQQQPVRNR
jgi:Fic family protein